MNLVYDNLVKGKRAMWLCNATKLHTMGYVPELGEGMALLGNTPDAMDQVWNLPCDEAITGEEWIKLFAEELKVPAKYNVLPHWMIPAIGLFIPVMKEIYEVSYQMQKDYIFDSSKFKNKFNFTPTGNKEAVHLTVEKLRQ